MINSPISLNLGIDFGTKYTKICVRDTDIDESWVVIPGQADSLLDSALILSQVGIRNDGVLIAGLTEAEWLKESPSCIKFIDFIKMRLACIDNKKESAIWYSPILPDFKGVKLSSPNAIENICAFFLYRVIQRSKDWICQNEVDRLTNRQVEWSVTVGVPVKYYDSPALKRFYRVLCLAWHFCEINIPEIKFNELDEYLDAVRESLDTQNIPCFVVPEIAASIYSYTFSRQAKQGVYIFFDIGGGTMEGAAFKFYRNSNNEQQIDLLTGLVEPIGVNALAKRITEKLPDKELIVSEAIIKQGNTILSNISKISKKYVEPCKKGDEIANKHKISVRTVKSKFKAEQTNIKLYLIKVLILAQCLIHRQVATVIRNCCNKLSSEQKVSISVFLGGGGKISKYYHDTIDSTYEAFNLRSTGMPRYQMLDVPVPSDFNMKTITEEQFHRFLIAYGLSIPDYQAPEFNLPSSFKNVPPRPPIRQWTPETSHDDG